MLWMAHIWVVLAVCVGAFAVDWGKYLSARATLRDAIDAGARAASMALEEGHDPRAAAVATIQDNTQGGLAVDISKLVVTSGNWDSTNRSFIAGGWPANSVQLSVSQPYSGGIFASPRSTVDASAVAHFQHRDIVLVLDFSGSMNSNGKASAMRKAVNDFCDIVTNEGKGRDRVALVRYSDTAQLLEPFSTDLGSLRTKSDSSVVAGATNIGGGLELGLTYAQSAARATAHSTIVLLTDGLANRPTDRDPIRYVRDQADRAKSMGVPVWAISFGVDSDKTLMDEVATKTDCKSFHVPDNGGSTEAELREVFRTIAAASATHFVK
jgi:Mg-chelatase subunit ChlD